MKRFFLFWAACIMQHSFLFAQSEQQLRDAQRAAFEARQVADPVTGKIPVDKLLEAYQATEQSVPKVVGPNWMEMGPINRVGGRVRSIVISPDKKKMFAGGITGGLWVTNYGSNPDWKPVSDLFSNLNVSTIAYDPSNPNIMYFGTGEDYHNDFLASVDPNFFASASTYNRGAGIWKSSDGGKTWAPLSATISPTDLTFRVVRKIVVRGNGDVFAATRQGVMQSTNGGTDWVKVLDGGMPFAGGVVPSDLHQVSDLEVGLDNTVYASMGLQQTNSAIFRSVGSGWEQLNRGNGMAASGQYKRIELACAPNAANVLYAFAENAVTGTGLPNVVLYRSADRGLTWNPISFTSMGITTLNESFAQPFHSLAIAVNPTNADNIYLGSRNLYRCENVTATIPDWEQLSWRDLGEGNPHYIHADHHQIIFESAPSGSPKVAYVASDGGVFRVSALDLSPTPSFLGSIFLSCSNYNNNFRATQFYTAAVSRGASTFDALGGFQDNGTELFSQSYLWLTARVNGGDGGYCFIHPNNTNLQVTSSQNGNYSISTDGNRSHSQPPVFASNKEHGAFITPTDWSILAGDVVNMISDGSIAGLTQIFRWNNIFGTNPTLNPFTDALLAGYKITFIKVSPNDKDRLYIGMYSSTTNDIRIVKVENINTIPVFTNFTGTFTGASSIKGYISCIAIKKSSTGATDDDDIVFTLSNYGVQSVWKKDFNAVINPINPNWSPLDLLSGGSLPGNLPDMPVRWAVFPPSLNNTFGHQLLLATETGVWATDYLNGTSTRWFPINNNRLPNVRTEALICRETDGMLFAATHGRGLWRSDVYTSSRVDFNANISVTDIWIPVYMGGRVKYSHRKSCTLNLTDLSTSLIPITSRVWHVNNTIIGSNSATVSVPYCGEQDIKLTINGVGMVKRLQEFINIPTVCPSCAPLEPIGQPVGFNKKVSEEESMGDLMVYPNPNQGIFNIQVEPDWGKIEQMEVYNSTGKLIQTSELASGEINIEQEPTGVYICRVKTSNGKVLIGKVLKQ